MEKEKTRVEIISEFAEGKKRNFHNLLDLIKSGELVQAVIINTSDENKEKTITIKSGILLFQFKEGEKDISYTLESYNQLVVKSCQLICE